MGVKSLWSLLTPVGRPVLLETAEGKTMAIDSSIWIYQFQATMRDKEGRALSNAHVLGFLRRISKLLFYGIKPVFVFDGGAPALKRNTITDRKKKKRGAAFNHAKVAERLLAAQMRREAMNHVESTRTTKNKGKGKEGAFTLDENTVYLEDIDPKMPKSPVKSTTAADQTNPQKKRFYDYDPYSLPDLDMGQVISKATQSTAPDPRLATEEELQSFIEDMRPDDFDVTSPAFRELPTEVQYEIIGDLRLKSRQTSYNRLQNMLKSSKTPLDFSKQQILNLKQRNALTQQLLTTTDSIGKAHIEIPIRIASERNREYVLVKNEGEFGGWILGIRDDGTKDKPIEIDQDEPPAPSQDSDEEMEENNISNGVADDHNLEHDGDASHQPALLFIPSDDDDDDDMLPFTIQASMDSQKKLKSSPTSRLPTTPPKRPEATTSDSLLYSNRLSTALAIGGAGPSRTPIHSQLIRSASPELEYISDGVIEVSIPRAAVGREPPTLTTLDESGFQTDSDDDMEEVLPTAPMPTTPTPKLQEADTVEPRTPSTFGVSTLLGPAKSITSQSMNFGKPHPTFKDVGLASKRVVSPPPPGGESSSSLRISTSSPKVNPIAIPINVPQELRIPSPLSETHVELDDKPEPKTEGDVDELELPISWSRSPSPDHGASPQQDPTELPSPSKVADHWDAAEEVDMNAEENEYARFMSQVQGKDLDSVRKEIDDEISRLNKEKKAALRDSEDITQQMISQIMAMLRLFGIPYITAPMEAEAQCAALVSLGLVEGIITDDSDVFLFGGQRVFKNMFNQSKTVECFLLSDLARELGLTRDALVRLAYLLGSDYVEGLPGVGPVVAMELLKEFPGDDGLHKFKDWWMKVQSGKDRVEDNQSAFRKRFKKKFKNLYLPQDWPNPAVRDAYYHPTVDESDEPFKWGLPDLDGLRQFLREELGWAQAKADEVLLPIVQRVGKRSQVTALNKQGTLNNFMSIPAGQGTYAPRKRTAYASKRLQQVVSDFRKNNRARSAMATSDDDDDPDHESHGPDEDDSNDEDSVPVKKKSKKSSTSKSKAKDTADGSGPKIQKATRGRGRGRGGSRGRGRGKRGAGISVSRSSSQGSVEPSSDEPEAQ